MNKNNTSIISLMMNFISRIFFIFSLKILYLTYFQIFIIFISIELLLA